MFKKLKEKITEEVKSSPQRFQQLTQSVSDRLQNASTSDENFFSIGEDDANTSNTSIEPGFTSVSLMSPQESRFRRNSNSSVASDVSFLPRYESVANMYHLQSDLEISASEMEDNASTSSQLGHLSKEQIYSAFQKSQMRYHKYRGRYTDLARHYKDLERENSKMKSVLVETQDKAIRRVTELKEQCTLEQKAKAHLEGALRDEIDEKQFKIQSLQTKIELLQNGNNSSQDSESLETLNKHLTDARQEIEHLNEKIQELKANAIIFQSKEQEYKLKIISLEKEISLFSEREKENNLSLAQNKMELHNELLSKDNEISNLKQDNEALRKSLEAMTSGNSKLENLQSQNKKLIDKLESLTQKCNGYESDLLKMEQYKIELQNANQINSDLKSQIKELDSKLETVREDAKTSLLSLESKIREKIQKEFDEKREKIKNEFKKKLEDISTNEDSLKETQLNLVEREQEIKQLREVNDQILEDLTNKTTKYNDLEKNHLELIEDSVKLRSKISSLEKELGVMQNNSQVSDLKIARLEDNITSLEKEIEDCKQLEDEVQILQKENNDLLERLHNNKDHDEKDSSRIIEDLESSLKNLEEERKQILERLELEQKKSDNLCQTEAQLIQEVKDLKASIQEREEKKKTLELKLEDEKEKLLQKLEASANTVKSLEETSLALGEELKELKRKNEEIPFLATKLENSVFERNQLIEELSANKDKLMKLEQMNSNLSETCNRLKNVEKEKEFFEEELQKSQNTMKDIEEANALLSVKIQSLQEEKIDIAAHLENKSKTSEDEVKSLEENNTALSEELNRMKRSFDELSVKLKQKDEEAKVLEMTINELNTELVTINDLLKVRNEETDSLKIEASKYSEMLHQKEESYLKEMKISEEERNQALDELSFLKKLLEEANNNLTIKEHELSKIEESCANSKERVEKLLQELESCQKTEKELSEVISNHASELKLKNQQIGTLSEKLQQYNDLIEERSEGFFKILNNFSGEPINNLRHNRDRKNLQNLEEKLQNFEKIFLVEKENLAKILAYLKQYEGKYSSMVREKEQLEKERDDFLAEISDLKGQIQEINSSQVSIKQIGEELLRLKKENAILIENEKTVKQNILELESRNTQIVSDSNFLSEENNGLITDIEELKIRNEELQTKYNNADATINNLKTEMAKLENNLKEATNQNNLAEMERHINELQHEKQLLQEEIEELKTAPINLHDNGLNANEAQSNEDYVKEIENLRTKVVQYKSLDLTNRSSIEFYENELQKLKNQNEKLNRKLDETLVTLGHCSELSQSTEIEYLKNVLYNYMLGKESLVLARVIAAVCKFDPHQTETILAKEQQKQTLLGQLGIL